MFAANNMKSKLVRATWVEASSDFRAFCHATNARHCSTGSRSDILIAAAWRQAERVMVRIARRLTDAVVAIPDIA